MQCKNEFVLIEEYNKNYLALMNFFRGKKVQRQGKRRKGVKIKRFESKLRYLAEQDFKCVDCCTPFNPGEDGKYSSATVDHVIPFRYGSTIAMNKEFVCSPCNQARENNRLEHIIRYFGTIEAP